MFNPIKALFGSRRERLLRSLNPTVERINSLEASIKALSDEALAAKTVEFRARLAAKETLDDLLPEAFAVVREASWRVLGLRHFDVQLLGGIALHRGKIAEMRTGEGKTLVATLPAYLNALAGKGVHVVTVNEYLAKRDAANMGQVFSFLGLTTGVVYPQQPADEKAPAYASDITYGTNNEFGFDYLRDNMITDAAELRQRGHAYAIVDEVDSILIDEARTPLIISGPDESPLDVYQAIDSLVPKLVRQEEEESKGDYFIDIKTKRVSLSESGTQRAEELLDEAGLLPDDLYGPRHLSLLAHLDAALRAHGAYARDQDYIVRDGEVVIIDEFTGRAMKGRRWGEGLHQAVEAKERVEIKPEDQVMATITLQNYFRGYDKLSGMTGTADTEAYELQEIYGLEVLVIPTHRPMIREDEEDRVFLTEKAKFNHVAGEIASAHARGQPVLVGTASIEASERLSALLETRKLPHSVLNAKQHELEASIIANAGAPGAITIATNMAGRGTDIVLGGHVPESAEPNADTWEQQHEAARASGGLYVIGTERHESRRIDNQLRGRSGRQGDPGMSRFFLSLEDHLLKAFMPVWAMTALRKTGMAEDQAIEARIISNQVEKAQRKIEGFYFDQRKALLEYDNVANQQRQAVYGHRRSVLASSDCAAEINALAGDWAESLAIEHLAAHRIDADHVADLLKSLERHGAPVSHTDDLASLALATESQEHLTDWLTGHLQKSIEAKMAIWPAPVIDSAQRAALLLAIDQGWREQLTALELLRKGIHLRAMAHKQPKEEYKREAFSLFQGMTQGLPVATLELILKHEPDAVQDFPEAITQLPPPPADEPVSASSRNALCHCGSGLRYKHCHGALVNTPVDATL